MPPASSAASPAGNTGLKPAYATNYDLGVEYYTRNTGLMSVNFYHKDIDKFIFSSKSEA